MLLKNEEIVKFHLPSNHFASSNPFDMQQAGINFPRLFHRSPFFPFVLISRNEIERWFVRQFLCVAFSGIVNRKRRNIEGFEAGMKREGETRRSRSMLAVEERNRGEPGKLFQALVIIEWTNTESPRDLGTGIERTRCARLKSCRIVRETETRRAGITGERKRALAKETSQRRQKTNYFPSVKSHESFLVFPLVKE